MELVSVVVPVYGVENDLEKCVHSIQRQTHGNLEIILVDDGSPDRCGLICDKLAASDGRIRVIHKENGGLSDARNAGMDVARGEYLLFVDSDDWIDPPMIEILHRLCQKEHAAIGECSFRNVFSDTIKEETKCTGSIVRATPLQAIESNLRWQWFKTVVWNKLYRRDVIGTIRFPKGKVHEDEFTTHKFYLAAKDVAYVDVSLYNYNKARNNSITGTIRLSNLDAIEAFHEKALLVSHHQELLPLQTIMCNNYCYIFYDKLSKCVFSGLQGQRMDEVVNMFGNDMAWMQHIGLEPHYVTLYDKLLHLGRESCAREWNRLVGRQEA